MKLCSMATQRRQRSRRGSTDTILNISGRDQMRPGEWQIALNSNYFKEAFFKFLSVERQNSKYYNKLNGHHIRLAFGCICLEYSSLDNGIQVKQIDELKCQHEEADTRMIFHIFNISSNSPDQCISVCSNDTEVFILLLYHIHDSSETTHVWMDAGISSNKPRHCIDLTTLARSLGQDLTDALPGFHAFTGTDMTAAFMNKGKLRPFETMKCSEVHKDTFSCVGKTIPLLSIVFGNLVVFVCHKYGKQGMQNTNDARFAYLQQYYAPKHNHDQLTGKNQRDKPCLYASLSKCTFL